MLYTMSCEKIDISMQNLYFYEIYCFAVQKLMFFFEKNVIHFAPKNRTEIFKNGNIVWKIKFWIFTKFDHKIFETNIWRYSFSMKNQYFLFRFFCASPHDRVVQEKHTESNTRASRMSV